MDRTIFCSFLFLERVLLNWGVGTVAREEQDLDCWVGTPWDRDFFLDFFFFFFFFFFFLRCLLEFWWRWRCDNEDDEVLELKLDEKEKLESSLLSEEELLLESEDGSDELTRDHLSELLEELELELELLEEISEEWLPGGGLRLFLGKCFDCDTVFALDLDAAFWMSFEILLPAGERLDSASSSEL